MRIKRNIKFIGELATIIGDEVSVAVSDCRDLISWMMNCYPETKRILRADNNISIGLIDDGQVYHWVTESDAKHGYIPPCESIVVVADIQGSGAEMAVALFQAFGSTILATSATAIVVGGIINIGISMALNVVIASLAEKPDTNTDRQDQSYMLNGASNNIRAGCAVPLLFGRWRASTVVISQSVTSERMVITHPDEINVSTAVMYADGNILANDNYGVGSELDSIDGYGNTYTVPCTIQMDAAHSISFDRAGNWHTTLAVGGGNGFWEYGYSVASANSSGFSVNGTDRVRITFTEPYNGYSSGGYGGSGVSIGNEGDSGSSGSGGGDAAGVGSGSA